MAWLWRKYSCCKTNSAEADSILSTVYSISNLSKEQQARWFYTKAQSSKTQQNPKDSINNLKKCILLNTDLANAWCGSQLHQLNYEQKDISLQQYINNMEKISWYWRNDIVEWYVLEQLSSVHASNNNYSAAMHALRTVAKYTPSPILSAEATNQMGKFFRQVFELYQGNNKNFTPLQAVSFFQEYSNYLPIGSKGDDIVAKVIDHFISLDMFDQAEVLLKHQINNRAFEYKKEVFINKLANLYLANLKPKQALELLLKNGDDWQEMYHTMSNARKIIYARVLLANGQYDDVTALLSGDYSENADTVLANTYWEKRQWSSFNEHSEPAIYKWRSSKKRLQSDDMLPLSKQILAYYLTTEKDLLHNLLSDFQQRTTDDIYGEFSTNIGNILTLPSESGVNGMQDLTEWRKIYEQIKSFDGGKENLTQL